MFCGLSFSMMSNDSTTITVEALDSKQAPAASQGADKYLITPLIKSNKLEDAIKRIHYTLLFIFPRALII